MLWESRNPYDSSGERRLQCSASGSCRRWLCNPAAVTGAGSQLVFKQGAREDKKIQEFDTLSGPGSSCTAWLGLMLFTVHVPICFVIVQLFIEVTVVSRKPEYVDYFSGMHEIWIFSQLEVLRAVLKLPFFSLLAPCSSGRYLGD